MTRQEYMEKINELTAKALEAKHDDEREFYSKQAQFYINLMRLSGEIDEYVAEIMNDGHTPQLAKHRRDLDDDVCI